MSTEPHPEQLPAPPPPVQPPPTMRHWNIRRLISTPKGDASLLLTPEPVAATSPQAAFDKWLSQQSPLPPEDVYRVIEAETVMRFDLKHDTVAKYTEMPPQ